MSVDGVVDELFRRESGRLVALLTRSYGVQNLDLAEDVVQETLLRALKHWAITGVPENPAAWLTATAKNLTVDALRRRSTLDLKIHTLSSVAPPEPNDERDRIALMFACCDPILPAESQIALTLSTLGGLSSSEIAGCLATQPNTVEQRISRAKKKLREATCPLRVPDPSEMPERLPAVLEVLYQVFGAGYSAHAGSEAVRIDLCSDALFLLQIFLGDKSTDKPPVRALYAVMLFLAARIPARTNDRGNVLRLEAQDRSLWDRNITTRAFKALERSLDGDEVSKFHVEAAILAEHARAERFQDTDWKQVVAHYDALLELVPSPVVRLNRAIAIGLADGPLSGLSSIDELWGEPTLEQNSAWHAARARFLSLLERHVEAREALVRASELADNGAEREHFRRLLGL